MKNNVFVPKVHLAAGGGSLISSSGASLLLQTASISGLATGLSQVLAPWRKPMAVTAWPTFRCCGPNLKCSDRLPPIPRSAACSTPWPLTSTRPLRRSGCRSGGSPASGLGPPVAVG